MRKKNSKCEFSSQRSDALLNNFRAYLARQSKICAKRAFSHAADAPAPRFWVSEARATRVITMMLNGIDLTESMYEEKRKMYREIFKRVKEIREIRPEMPVGDIVFDVVNSPAPSSYISRISAERIIRKAKKTIR